MLKTRIFTALVVISNILGNFSLTWGMRQVGSVVSLSPWPYIAALFNPWVALGVSLLIVWLISQMTLLSWADLSYVLAALAGRVFLHEEISLARWAGIALIMGGVIVVSRTAPQAKPQARAAAAGAGR